MRTIHTDEITKCIKEKCCKCKGNRIVRINEELTAFHKEVLDNLNCIITGNDIGCGRYASVSWRSRNIRGIVLKNIYTIMWRNFGTSGIDR